MANREQRNNREKKKPKTSDKKTAKPAVSSVRTQVEGAKKKGS